MPRPLGVTSLQILAAIRDGHAYGLEIVAHTGLPSGTVYPTLGRLERSALVRSRWEDRKVADQEARPRRRYYALTHDGAAALARGTARIREAALALDPDAAEDAP